jgi:hypothetical protein
VGATVLDVTGNPRQPFFHARDYGLVLANAFGRKAYGAIDSPPPVTLEPGESLRLTYALLLHGDVPDDRLAGLVARVHEEIAQASARMAPDRSTRGAVVRPVRGRASIASTAPRPRGVDPLAVTAPPR